jgi:hypothetical protein
MMANVAHAKVSCSITNETIAGSSNYDKLIYTGSVEESAIFVLTQDGKVATIQDLAAAGALPSAKNQQFFSVSAADGRLSMGSGRIDLSSGNVTRATAISSSPLSKEFSYLISDQVVVVCNQL